MRSWSSTPDVKARLAMAEACFRDGEYSAASSLYESVFGDQFNEASHFMLISQGIDAYWLGMQLGFAMRAAARPPQAGQAAIASRVPNSTELSPDVRHTTGCLSHETI